MSARLELTLFLAALLAGGPGSEARSPFSERAHGLCLRVFQSTHS